MPIFRVDLEQHVSRRVELRQTTSVIVEATDLMAAKDAVLALAHDENELCQYAAEWSDENASRQASNDEVEKRPVVTHAGPCGTILGGPVYDAMPEVPDAE